MVRLMLILIITGKIYKVTFDDGLLYIGCTYKTLRQRLNNHLRTPNSPVFKNRDNNPPIELLTDAPSVNRQSLEHTEKAYMEIYAAKFGNNLLNILSKPLITRCIDNIKLHKLMMQKKLIYKEILMARIKLLNEATRIFYNPLINFSLPVYILMMSVFYNIRNT